MHRFCGDTAFLETILYQSINIYKAMIELLLQLLALLFLFLVPGYITLSVFFEGRKDGFANLQTLEVLFLIVLTSILLASWIGITLAELGFFSILNLLILLLAYSSILYLRFKPNLSFIKVTNVDYTTLFLLVIILFTTLFLFFKPFEWISGGRDPGVYVNTGVNIARTGSIEIYDKELEGMSDNLKEAVYQLPQNAGDSVTIFQFPGFYMTRSGRVLPQFFHLYPVLIAIFYSILGLKAGLYITPLLGLLAVLSVFFAGSRIFNRNVGFIAALLLSLNFAEVWFSRYPNSEIVCKGVGVMFSHATNVSSSSLVSITIS